MTITRSAAESFADAFDMSLSWDPDTGEVEGHHEKCEFRLSDDFKVVFDWEVVGSFGHRGLRGADAGLLLMGPGDLRGLLCREDDRLTFSIVDARLISGEGMTGVVEDLQEAWRLSKPAEGTYLTADSIRAALADAVKETWIQENPSSGWSRVSDPLTPTLGVV